MIERLYIDNVRSFVNFEWRPARLNLLLGANGTGKTLLLETLFAVRSFLTGEASVSETFDEASRTRWDTRPVQTIELDVRAGGGLYRYRLVVEHDESGRNGPLVASESLQFGDSPAIEFKTADLNIHRSPQAKAIAGPTRSGVSTLLSPSGRSEFFSPFQEWIWNLWLLRPDPRAMSARIDRRARAPWLEKDLSNFATWYLSTLASQPRDVMDAIRAVEPGLPGLFELRDAAGTLEAVFERAPKTSSYAFDELSDGERTLIALYVVLHVLAGPGRVLLLDEPDNYLGLREIQPWLAELSDRALRSTGPQVILISHHPDALNFLAPERGWRVFRDPNSQTRIQKFEVQGSLEPAEAAARGWDETQ